MKLDSVEMCEALAACNWDRATAVITRHFAISIKPTPRVVFDENDDRAIVAVSDGRATYYWSSDRGFSKDAYSWVSGYQIRIGKKWWDLNA